MLQTITIYLKIKDLNMPKLNISVVISGSRVGLLYIGQCIVNYPCIVHRTSVMVKDYCVWTVCSTSDSHDRHH